MTERELRDALARLAAGEDAAARERAWRVVRGAHAERVPMRRARWRLRSAVVVVALAVVAAAAGVAGGSPRSGVGRAVRDVLGLGQPGARSALGPLPGGGRLLVTDGSGAWVVASDGSRRRLGSYTGAAWSPRGLFVAAWRGGVLTALEPTGKAHWSLSRPAPITAARWSPVDGFRIAYLSGADGLWVVNGNGTGNRRFAAARTSVAPAWRPDDAHVLAFVDPRGQVEVAAVDTGRRLWRSTRLARPVALAWSRGGSRLAVVTRRDVVLYDRAGKRVGSRRLAGGTAVAWAPTGVALAVTRTDVSTGMSALTLLYTAHHLRGRVLFSGPGRFGTPAWAPDGRSLLLPWPDAGQWLFLHPAGSGRRSEAIAHVARQFSPGVASPRFPDTVGWCCGRAPRPGISATQLEHGLRTNPNNPASATCHAATAVDRRAARTFADTRRLFVCDIALRGQPAATFDVQVLANRCFVAERRRRGQADYGCVR